MIEDDQMLKAQLLFERVKFRQSKKGSGHSGNSVNLSINEMDGGMLNESIEININRT